LVRVLLVGESDGRAVTVGVQELPFDALVQPVFEDLEVDGDVVPPVEVWVGQALGGVEPGPQSGEFRGRPVEVRGRPLDVLLQVTAVLLLQGQDKVVPDAAQEVRLQADNVVAKAMAMVLIFPACSRNGWWTTSHGISMP
jgi:hypothetical protein